MSSDPHPPDAGSTDGTRSFAAARRLSLLAETRAKPSSPGGMSTDAPDATPTPFVPHLPRYEIRRSLGRGAMGHVYLAWDRQLRVEVALKFMLRQADAPEAAVARFDQEAKILAQLHHPNVVRVFDAGEADGCLYFAMRYVAGGSLARQWERARTTAAGAVGLVRKLAAGVHHAHSRGVFHRDLKPANVLLDGDEPLATDFGIAKWDDSDLSTGGLTLLGTPPYMAPEVLAGGSKGYDARGDVYSLGVILYQLLAGDRPHEVEFRPSAGWVRTPDTPRPLADHPAALPGIDDRLEAVVRKALAVDPAHRYPSADEFAGDLERWQNGEGVLAEKAVPTPPRKRPRLRAAASIACGILLLALGIWLALAPGRSPPTSATAAPPDSPDDILRRVKDGQRVELTAGDVDLTRFFRPVEPMTGVMTPAGSEVTVSSESVALFELFGEEPPFPVTVTVRLRHAGGSDQSRIGLYARRKAHRLPDSATGEFFLANWLHAILPPDDTPASGIAWCQWVWAEHGGSYAALNGTGEIVFPPARTTDADLVHELAITIGPDDVASTCDRQHYPGDLGPNSLAQSLGLLKAVHHRTVPVPAAGRGVGVVVAHGSAAVSGLTVAPAR